MPLSSFRELHLVTVLKLLKRSVFNTIDIFDEKFNSYGGEDTDLAIRLWEAYPTSLRFSPHAISENHGNQKFEDF